MAKKIYPEYHNPDKPKYTAHYTPRFTRPQSEINNPNWINPNATNIWYPNMVLQPWLHKGTLGLVSCVNAEGNGPTWDDMYTLQEFVMNWKDGWPLTHLSTKYNLTPDRVRTICDNLRLLGTGKETKSALIHFALKLLSNEPIIKPDIILHNPFPPNEVGIVDTVYTFYKVPKATCKEYEIGYSTLHLTEDLYYCPQHNPGSLIVGNTLLAFLNRIHSTEFKELYTQFILERDTYKYSNHVLADNHDYPINFRAEDIHNIKQYAYAVFNNMFDDNKLTVTLDSELPGREHDRDTSCVYMYKQVWVEEYIKRTIWDQCTEHSLVRFSDAIHDTAHYIVGSTGKVYEGVYEHRPEYFTMPTPIRAFLHSIGVKGKCTKEFYPGGDLIHPIFDYVVRVGKDKNGLNTIVPFKRGLYNIKDYCAIDYATNKITANGAILKLDSLQWESLIKYMVSYELFNRGHT